MRYVLAVLVLSLLPAPSWALANQKAVALALIDLDKQNSDDQPFLRYLFLPKSGLDQTAFEQALRLHVNLIGREAKLAYPAVVAEGLWRVDFRDFQWSRDVWEKLADVDPYFHRKQVTDVFEEVVVWKEFEVEVEYEVEVDFRQPYGHYDTSGKFCITEYRNEKKKEKRKRVEVRKRRVVEKAKRQVVKRVLYVPNGSSQLAALAAQTNSNAPIVRADWFLVQGARQISLNNQQTGVGYYDWLQIADRDGYFRLVGFDLNVALQNEKQIRAVVNDSGISAQNRQIDRFGSTNGPLWRTLDTFDQSGKGIAIQELRNGEFLHNVEEHYAPLANGLPVVLLCDDKGVRQDSAPDKIGGNRTPLNPSADLRIHIGISCWQCHGGGILNSIEDEVRPVYTGRLGVLSNDKKIALELSRQYSVELNRVLDRDRAEYQEAFNTASRTRDAKDAITLYSNAFTKYAYDKITLQTAATELGVAPEAFRKALADAAVRLGQGDFRLDPFLLSASRPIARLTWEDAFQDAQDLLFGILKEEGATGR